MGCCGSREYTKLQGEASLDSRSPLQIEFPPAIASRPRFEAATLPVSQLPTQAEDKANEQLPTPRNDRESRRERVLDMSGDWSSNEGVPIAVVRGLDVQLLGDGAGLKTSLIPLSPGVWSIQIEEEKFVGECRKRDDGTLALQWNDGETWVRQENGSGAEKQTVSTGEQTKQSEFQDASDDVSDSSSSRSSSTTPLTSPRR
mmetsp:Transcript_62026/g.110298  ORF Transcript_62026/g.110298 Transcript_62026/m.110298 type:complete len:201 (-) Transcript_62026:194-796(-)